MDHFCITIGRQLGSGGSLIGERLAAKLNIPFYDKELIMLASKESGVGKEFFEKFDETTRHRLFGGLLGMRSSLIDEIYTNYYMSNESLFQIQSNVIRELAGQGSCLFIGRCADYVLSKHRNCLNVFIYAGMEDRVKRIAEVQQLEYGKAREQIIKTDKKRAAYYNYFSNKKWGAAESYHLCINSSFTGIEGATDCIFGVIKGNRK